MKIYNPEQNSLTYKFSNYYATAFQRKVRWISAFNIACSGTKKGNSLMPAAIVWKTVLISF